MRSKRKENAVQQAIADSLAVYCAEENLQLFPPYPNQQGAGMNRYCADLVGLLGDAEILLLEIKQLDLVSGLLLAFDEEQHAHNVRFESIGVPLAYAYGMVEALPYYMRPKPAGWAVSTLNAVNRSVPSQLPHRCPDTWAHTSLLEWLCTARGGDTTELFGRVHGAIRAASDLQNGVLVLLYGVAQRALAALGPEEVMSVLMCLQSGLRLDPSGQAKLHAMLGASAQTFSLFVPPTPPGSADSYESPRP